jgi:DNA-binding transcriptional LysR family regulator
MPSSASRREQGLGTTLLPEFAVTDQLMSGTLVRLGLDIPELNLRLVWRTDRETLPGLREVLYAASAGQTPPTSDHGDQAHRHRRPAPTHLPAG